MKRLLALSALVPALFFAAPAPSHAGSSTDAALALGAFAVFNQLLRGETVLHDLFGGGRTVVRETVVVQPPPPVVYGPPPPRVVYMAPPVVVVQSPPRMVYVPVRQTFVRPGHMKRFQHGHGHWKD